MQAVEVEVVEVSQMTAVAPLTWPPQATETQAIRRKRARQKTAVTERSRMRPRRRLRF